MSTDTVRSEMDSGALGYIIVGQRVRRIPHEALEQRISRWRGESDSRHLGQPHNIHDADERNRG